MNSAQNTADRDREKIKRHGFRYSNSKLREAPNFEIQETRAVELQKTFNAYYPNLAQWFKEHDIKAKIL